MTTDSALAALDGQRLVSVYATTAYGCSGYTDFADDTSTRVWEELAE